MTKQVGFIVLHSAKRVLIRYTHHHIIEFNSLQTFVTCMLVDIHEVVIINNSVVLQLLHNVEVLADLYCISVSHYSVRV